MISKDQIAAVMLRECDICVHLHSKIPAGALDYRPTPGQRSTLELLQYLSFAPIAALGIFETGDWSQFGPQAEAAKLLTAAEFPAAMERQKAAITKFFAERSESDFETRMATLPGGRGEAPLGFAIMSGPMIWIAAYKMQLFLYAKSAGAHELGTSNVWGGRDPVPAA